MTRSINEIQQSIEDDLTTKRPDLRWTVVKRLSFIYVVAKAIHLFETILDKFRSEINIMVETAMPGTLRWYIDQCKRFQNGHELLFDENTMRLYYAKNDPSAQIINVCAITDVKGVLCIRVAKLNEQNKIVPLSDDELCNFRTYVESMKFAGIQTIVNSLDADKIYYDAQVFYNPMVPVAIVRERVEAVLDKYRFEHISNATLYTQRFVNVIRSVPDVFMVNMDRLSCNESVVPDSTDTIKLMSGYFDYTDDSKLSFTPSNEMER